MKLMYVGNRYEVVKIVLRHVKNTLSIVFSVTHYLELHNIASFLLLTYFF
jgi:hypothetical protein